MILGNDFEFSKEDYNEIHDLILSKLQNVSDNYTIAEVALDFITWFLMCYMILNRKLWLNFIVWKEDIKMNDNPKILNAQIKNVSIYYEDHGILTFGIAVDISDGTACVIGGLVLF